MSRPRHPDSAVTGVCHFDKQAGFMVKRLEFSLQTDKSWEYSPENARKTRVSAFKRTLGLLRLRKKTWEPLKNDGFHQPFLYWAARYVKITSVDLIFETRQSVVELIADNINDCVR